MDPDTALADLRSTIRSATRLVDQREPDPRKTLDTLSSLIDSVTALDQWMSRGGYPPRPWKH